MEVIGFPDVEELLIAHLSARLVEYGDTATVHTVVPNPRPTRFVLVPRVGGVRTNLVVDTATIAFECWASAAGKAYKLCQLVRAFVLALPGITVNGVAFYRVEEFAGPANLPDPASAQARYVWTASVSVRGSTLTP